MKKFINSNLLLIISVFKEFSNTLDNVNTAWHDGKALEHFELAIKESGEISDVADVSVQRKINEVPSKHTNVVIVTESVPSRTALFKMRRTLEKINRRFGTHLTAQIIQRSFKMSIAKVA